MPITVPQVAALLTRRANDDLLILLENTPDERLQWKAVGAARTILELVQECAIVNQKWALLISRGGYSPGGPEFPELLEFQDSLQNTRPDITQALQRSTNALFTAIQAVPVADLELWINRSRTSPQLLTLAEACLYPYWHTVYHEGQINHIQLEYGDTQHYHNYHLVPRPAENRFEE